MRTSVCGLPSSSTIRRIVSVAQFRFLHATTRIRGLFTFSRESCRPNVPECFDVSKAISGRSNAGPANRFENLSSFLHAPQSRKQIRDVPNPACPVRITSARFPACELMSVMSKGVIIRLVRSVLQSVRIVAPNSPDALVQINPLVRRDFELFRPAR